jgi:phosphate transport system permease protein
MTVHDEVAAAGPSDSTDQRAGGDTALKPSKPSNDPAAKRARPQHSQRAEIIFRSLATAAGAIIVAAIALIALFLLIRAVPSVLANEANFFTSTDFNTSDANHLRFGIRDLFMVTVLSSIFALVLAVPIGIGIALFLTH